MLLYKQDVVDNFDKCFWENLDGQVFFQPKDSDLPVEITREEYELVTAAFERNHMLVIAATVLAISAAGIYGGYKVLFENAYLPFFVGLGVAVLFSFALMFREGLGLKLPFIYR